MPVIANAQLPTTPPQTPPDVIDPVRYRFGGYVLERDLNDNIIHKASSTHQPASWGRRAFRYSPPAKLR